MLARYHIVETWKSASDGARCVVFGARCYGLATFSKDRSIFVLLEVAFVQLGSFLIPLLLNTFDFREYEMVILLIVPIVVLNDVVSSSYEADRLS